MEDKTNKKARNKYLHIAAVLQKRYLISIKSLARPSDTFYSTLGPPLDIITVGDVFFISPDTDPGPEGA